MNRPRLAITMGDAAGVGPEIIVKALARGDLFARCRPFVVGDMARLAEAARITGITADLRRLTDAAEARFEPGVIECLDLDLIPSGLRLSFQTLL